MCTIASQFPPHQFSLKQTSRNYQSWKLSRFLCRSSSDGNEDYFLDAPVSVGDGFSFSGGKYSDEPSPADEWFKQGRIVSLLPVLLV
nr:epoxide hydrolase 3 isoform X1 [Ipomoea batatas]